MTSLPAEVVAFLDVDPRELDDVTLGERLAALEELTRRTAAAQAAAVRVFDVRDAADAAGSPSAAAWLCAHTGAAERDARALISLGRGLDRLPAFAAALAEGAVTAAHVRTVIGATRTLDPSTVAEGETFLAATARRLDARRFATVVRRWLATVAPAEFERDTEKRYDSRWLTLSETFAGMVNVSGMLDPEAGHLVRQAVDALTATNPANDTRSREQQRADALVDLVAGTSTSRPEIVVHVPAATLAGEPAAPPAELASAGPVSPATLDRLSCDAGWTRLLLDAAAVPIELGRSRRTIPASLRKFVAIRDGGCRYPGCTRPPAHCEAHHVTYWRHGGRTDHDNLALLCRYHHHLVHERHHRMKLLPDHTVEITRPDGTTLTGHPRGPTDIPLL